MRFLSVRPDFCRRLPSDSTSRWTPLPLAICFPSLGRIRDFHPLEHAHAGRTIGKSGTHFVRDVTFSGCSVPYWHRPQLLELNGETEVSHYVTAIGLSLNARQDVHRQAAERLALMGGAVSVRQSLPGLRSCQSQPHGCCLMSGFAAVAPTRPANSVLGGSATSSASLQSHSNFISLHR